MSGQGFTEKDLEDARRMAPKMDDRSLGIFMASGLFDMMREGVTARAPQPTHHRGSHYDVTGYFQRTRRSR